jgi:glycosyltransferase involved in cell wall biosynthesis
MQRRYASQTLAGAAAGIATNALAVRLLRRQRATLTIEVIPFRGVVPPLDPAPPPDDDVFHLGYVGRLVAERGAAVLFEACVRIHGQWSLTVIGSGPAQEELERQAERLGIAARVEWRGGLPRSALSGVWPQLHCLVVPSKTTPGWIDTGTPALLEAMAYGVPPVASDTGALPDVIDGGGIIVPEGDPDRLTQALKELKDDPKRRRELGGLARKRILAEYTDTALARKTIRLWQGIVSKGTATP